MPDDLPPTDEPLTARTADEALITATPETTGPAEPAPAQEVADGADGADGAGLADGAEAADTPAPETDTAAQPATAAPPRAAAVADLPPAACAAKLAELFPALFGRSAARPLKLRIQADIQQRAPGVFTKKSLSIFLHRHTTSTPYLVALSQSPTRFDLDGAAAGELAPEHREAAVTELARRRGLHEARRAAEQAARREADAQARQAHAAEHDARRERAALLRAFETTTLTPHNFCALKGIAEAELQVLLAQARVEREQRPPEPRPEHRPAHGRGPAPGAPGAAGQPRRDGGARDGRDGRDAREARGPRGPDEARKGRPRPPQRPASR